MPRISEFFGIVIEMFWNDHGTPHFHAKYAEFKASIAIDKLDVRGDTCRLVSSPGCGNGPPLS
jgi:hypothetical protein